MSEWLARLLVEPGWLLSVGEMERKNRWAIVQASILMVAVNATEGAEDR